MRSGVLFVAVGILTASLLPLYASDAAAQVPIPSLSITVLGETVDGATVFVPLAILIPQVPINITLTFINNESAGSGIPHTFTIRDADQNIALNTDSSPIVFVQPQERRVLNFTINSMTNVTFEGRSFQPEPVANGTIRYFCIPHEQAGMVGWIVLASAAAPTGVLEKGINIRAYWIGLIGLFATAFWIGISYFVIKSSTPHFKDQKEHIRRGLP